MRRRLPRIWPAFLKRADNYDRHAPREASHQTTAVGGSAKAHLGDRNEFGNTYNVEHYHASYIVADEEPSRHLPEQSAHTAPFSISTSNDPPSHARRLRARPENSKHVDLISFAVILAGALSKAAKICWENGGSRGNTPSKTSDGVRVKIYGRIYSAVGLFGRHVRAWAISLPISEQAVRNFSESITQVTYCHDAETLRCMDLVVSCFGDELQSVLGEACAILLNLTEDKNLKIRLHLTVSLPNLHSLEGQPYTDVADGYPSWVRRQVTMFQEISTTCQIRTDIIMEDAKLQADLENLLPKLNIKPHHFNNLGEPPLPLMKARELQMIITRIDRARESFQALISSRSRSLSTSYNSFDGTTLRERPSYHVTKLSRVLHSALCERLPCTDCVHHPYMTKLCIQFDEHMHKQSDPDYIAYKLLMPKTAHVQKELEIRVRSSTDHLLVTSRNTINQAESIHDICSTIQTHQTHGNLNLTVVHFDQDKSTEMTRDRDYLKSKLGFRVNTFHTSLAQVLHKLDLPQKRKTALALAYACMTLGCTPWLAHWWTKHDVLLYFDHLNQPCLSRPMISSILESRPTHNDEPILPPEICHSIPTIASLGIVLLELETGQPVENLRSDKDLVDGFVDDNTDLLAAMRTIEEHTTCTPLYKDAVLACLDWQSLVQQDVNPSLAEERVRSQIYSKVIEKLEAEVDALKLFEDST